MAENYIQKYEFSFQEMISMYGKLQSKVGAQIKAVSANTSSVTPGAFLLLQFQMSQASQVGESVSNMMSQINGIIKGAVGNLNR